MNVKELVEACAEHADDESVVVYLTEDQQYVVVGHVDFDDGNITLIVEEI